MLQEEIGCQALPFILPGSTTGLILKGEGEGHLYAISLVLSETPQVRYSISHTLQMRKIKVQRG